MTLEERLLEDMKSAMKAGQKAELATIRMLRAQLKDARISKRADLTEEDVEAALQQAAKRRREAIELYLKGNRQDLVDKEQNELEIINKYLPKQLSEDEIKHLIDGVIKKLGISDEKDIGKLMGSLMPQVKGKADGKMVQQLARTALANLSQ
jgi:uncharacterized protein YqeY